MEQYIVFESNNQRFAIDIPQIEKVLECNKVKEIPDSSDYLLGYMQYNDKFLPIIDLKSRLYNISTTGNKDNKIIVIQWKEGHIGLLVDKIDGIKKFNKDQYEETNNEYQIIKEYILGFFNIDDSTIIILDTDKVFTPDQEEEILKATNQETDPDLDSAILKHGGIS